MKFLLAALLLYPVTSDDAPKYQKAETVIEQQAAEPKAEQPEKKAVDNTVSLTEKDILTREIALDRARLRMETLIERALAEGVIQETVDEPVAGNFPDPDDQAVDLNYGFGTQFVCLPDEAFQFGFTEPQPDVLNGLNELQGTLVGEFDRPSRKALSKMSRALIGYGLTAEFRNLRKSFPDQFRENNYLESIAYIVDGNYSYADQDAAYRLGQLRCPGFHGFWQAVNAGEVNDLRALHNPNAELAASRRMTAIWESMGMAPIEGWPGIIRHHLAARYAIVLTRERNWAAAAAILEAIPQHFRRDDYVQYLSALLARYEDRPEDAVAALTALTRSGSAIAARALIDFQNFDPGSDIANPITHEDESTLAKLNAGDLAGEAIWLTGLRQASKVSGDPSHIQTIFFKLAEAYDERPDLHKDIVVVSTETILASLDHPNQDVQVAAMEAFEQYAMLFDPADPAIRSRIEEILVSWGVAPGIAGALTTREPLTASDDAADNPLKSAPPATDPRALLSFSQSEAAEIEALISGKQQVVKTPEKPVETPKELDNG